MGLGGGYGGAADRDDESERAPLARVRAPVPACPPPSRQALTLEGRAGGPQASSSEEDVHDPLAEDGGLRNKCCYAQKRRVLHSQCEHVQNNLTRCMSLMHAL